MGIGHKVDCEPCEGTGAIRTDDFFGYTECESCKGRGYRWTSPDAPKPRTDSKPDGTRKARRG